MQAINYYHHILKGIHMEIIKSDIQITLTKTQLVDLVIEALSTDAGPAIKRAITPLLADSFPQFPQFTSISIQDTDESGQTVVTLRQPPKPRATKPPSDLKSMEPLDVVTPVADDSAI
jgi:hypothetical protein